MSRVFGIRLCIIEFRQYNCEHAGLNLSTVRAKLEMTKTELEALRYLLNGSGQEVK